MKKMALVAAAVAAAGVTLLSAPSVLAQPAPAPAAGITLAAVDLEAGGGPEALVSQAEVDRAVERHLHALLKARLKQMREERARAAGVR